MMERLKPAPSDVTGSFLDGRAQPDCIPQRLGDFRILREIGRGGMGIVFEAEQESLGRHVALKVLPSHALLNPRHLQRFLREARAAARLHHTNIVPVFGVGEGDGLHYYVMQFITGSGLHEVIEELKRLKTACRPTAQLEAGASEVPTRSIHQVAQGLLTGRFIATPVDGTTDAGAPNGQPAAGRPGASAIDVHPPSSILSGSGRSFANSVARVGLQVAEALGYAHGQGVLHRDIKPSNLLLDVQGTVWVTDFGLAKAMADTDGLTQEGDVLGTLRYMAPERFRGQADARTDLHALGLTLYELLTLRPAFDEQDRDRLIHQVTSEVPPRPRSLNAEIPRDLETIVLKAMEHDPARRYQDAEELAEDLGRFLADQPIKARPVGVLERAWKWAQRKPAIASLLAALALAVVLGFAGITWQWREAVAARNIAILNASKARTNFEHALETVNTFCTQVSEEQLLDQPGMHPLRRRLLELALQYYQRFQREQGDDPSLLRELASTFNRSGLIASELGDAAAAQRALLRARDILEQLCRDNPKDVALRVQLAQCDIDIEDGLRVEEIDRISNFIYEHNQSVALMESLVSEHPENPDYLRLLGRSYSIDGIRQIRGLAAREDTLKKSIATLKRVRCAAPDDVEAARWLALAYADLGLVYQETGHHVDRIQALERALAILEALEERSPKARRRRLDRARCLAQLGAARIDCGQFRRAAIDLHEAEGRLGHLREEDRDAVDIRYWLAVARQGLGRVALARGENAAGKLLGDAIALYEQAPAQSLSGRDRLMRAWSNLWLSRAELHASHPEAVPPLQARVNGDLEAYRAELLRGEVVTNRSREVMEIVGLVDPWLASDLATTTPARIAAQQLQVQAWQSLAGKQKDNPALQFEVAWSHVQLAELQEQDGRTVDARSSLAAALPMLEKLAQAEPENLRRCQGLARAWETLGRIQARSGQKTEAQASAEKALAMARVLAQTDLAYAYDLACALALRGRLSSSRADEDEAVAALRRAIKDGFDNGHLLRTDPRLDGLRSRPDFPAPPGTAG
jgi:serine/threonine-protein kinase